MKFMKMKCLIIKLRLKVLLQLKIPLKAKKLEVFAQYLTDIEKNLPLDDKHKNYSARNRIAYCSC